MNYARIRQVRSSEAREEILAAGYESVADARRALNHLESRRDRIVDLELDARISGANSLDQIEAQIELLRRLLAS